MSEARDTEKTVWLADAALAGALALAVHAPTPHAWGAWVSSAAGLAFLGLIYLSLRHPSSPLRLPRQAAWFGPLLLTLCASLQLRAILRLPIDAEYADMLPLIRDAIQTLGQGMNPYRFYHYPWPLPLTFLPGLWLPYAPLSWLGLDLRWLGWVAGLVLLSRLNDRSFRGLLLLAVLATASKFTEFSRICHLSLYWLLLRLFAEDYRAGRRRQALWLGLLLATRQTAWLLLPFVWRIEAVGLAGLLILPFFLWSPSAFLQGTFLWYRQLGDYVYGADPLSVTGQIGFAGLFYEAGLQTLLPLALLLAWLGLRPWRQDRLSGGALTLALFALGSAPSWWYSLLDPFFLLAGSSSEPRFRRLSLGLASGVALLWLWGFAPGTRELGFEDRSLLLEGFDHAETVGSRTFTWALAPRARVALPCLRPFHGTIVLEARAPKPARIEIELNGRMLGVLNVGPRWETRSISVPAGWFVVGNNSLVFRGKAATWPPGDPRPLMLALDRLILKEGVD